MFNSLRWARFGQGLSAFLLVASFAAVVASSRPEWSRIVVYLMWNHVAILAATWSAGYSLRRLSLAGKGRASPRPRELFAPWILGAALASGAAAIPVWRSAPDPEGFAVFARGWVVFSFMSLLMWRFVLLSRRDAQSAEVAAPPAAAAPDGWKSTVAIVAIWIVVIGWGLLGVARPSATLLCAAPMPPGLQSLVVLMPLVVFVAMALFSKRSPFASPWLASLADERFGAGSHDRFMVRLKPLLLFSASGFVGAATLAMGCRQAEAAYPGMPVAFLSCSGMGFALAHVIMRRRGIPGI